jgi:hypothetical protein
MKIDPYCDVFDFQDGTIIIRWIKRPFSGKLDAVVYCFPKKESEA